MNEQEWHEIVIDDILAEERAEALLRAGWTFTAPTGELINRESVQGVIVFSERGPSAPPVFYTYAHQAAERVVALKCPEPPGAPRNVSPLQYL